MLEKSCPEASTAPDLPAMTGSGCRCFFASAFFFGDLDRVLCQGMEHFVSPEERRREFCRRRDQLCHIFHMLLAGIVFWSAVILASSVWNFHLADEQAVELAQNEAKANFNKDMSLRLWASAHGGVYVETGSRTPPNPYLVHVPERDIVTPAGRKLTLMNPAYMIRQMMEENAGLYGVRSHITSLRPIRPENAADLWETAALKEFDRGVPEKMEISEIGGVRHLRYMQSMVTRTSCLKCHAHQGYKAGEVRGGISVSVSMQPFLAAAGRMKRVVGFSHFFLWLVGIGFVTVMAIRGKNRQIGALEMDARLQASEQRFRMLCEGAMDAIVLMDREGKIAYWNPSAAKMFGYGKEEALGQDLHGLLAPEELQARAAARFKCLAGGLADPQQLTRTVETTARRKDGSRFAVEVSISCNVLGEGWFVVGVIRDVSERESLAAERLRSRNLESLGILAGGIAHDFNNLFTVILGNVSLAKMQAVPHSEQARFLDETLVAARRSKEITSRLIAFSRGGVFPMEIQRPGVLLREEASKVTNGTNIVLESVVPDDLWTVSGDEGQLRLLFRSLTINALEAMPEGGVLTVRAMNIASGRAACPLLEDIPHIKISLQDTGRGIPAEYLEKIFDPYFTTKPLGIDKGVGLGLTICRAVAVQHRGRLLVESNAGGGAIFHVWLPAIKARAGAGTEMIDKSA